MRLRHQDGIHGWDKWESMFEDTLCKEFNIKPLVGGSSSEGIKNASPAVATGSASSREPYSRTALERLSSAYGFAIEDLTSRGGNLWVRADDSKKAINNKLALWGFRYKSGKGWWK